MLWDDFDDVEAFTVGNDSDVKFVEELFDYRFCCYPFRSIEDGKASSYYGLWWFDPDRHYGEWVRVDDQIKRWTDIKNKFIKDG